MEVLAILKNSARPVHTVSTNQTVEDAVNVMTAENVSALVVVTQEKQPAGIFTERDFFRLFLKDKTPALLKIKLKNAMTNKLITADPKEDISDLVTPMIQSDINYLPVVENKKIVGLLSINDLLEHQIDSLTDEIHDLKEYINDLHEAGLD
jgi:CBS domain-containing protein